MIKVILYLCFFNLFSLHADAKYASKDSISWKLNQEIKIFLKKDGTYIEEKITEKSIQNQLFIDHLKKVEASYDPTNEKLELIWVKKCLNGKCTKINTNGKILQTKSKLEHNGQISQNNLRYLIEGIDQRYRIKYKFRKTKFASKFNNWFNYYIDFTSFGRTDNFKLKIESEVPLYVSSVSLPKEVVLKASEKRIEVELNKDFSRYFLKDNKELTELRFDKKPSIYISTEKDWISLASKIEKNFRYENKEVTSLLTHFKHLKSHKEIIEAVFHYIRNNYTYYGNWTRLDSGVKPRSLKSIISSKYGDCKDLTLLTVALLRNMGINAEIALVHRISQPVYGYFEIPTTFFFNHVVVSIPYENSRLWLDPTNDFYSHGFVSNDILSSKALLINGDKRLTTIQKNNLFKNSTKKESFLERREDGDFNILTTITYMGESAGKNNQIKDNNEKNATETYYVNQLNNHPTNRNALVKIISGKFATTKKSIQELQLVTEEPFNLEVPQGFVIDIDLKLIDVFKLIDNDNNLTALANVGITHNISRYIDYELVGINQYKCKIQSPWLDISLDVTQSDSGIQLNEWYEMKRRFILVDSEFDRIALKDLIKEYNSCLKKKGVIIKYKN